MNRNRKNKIFTIVGLLVCIMGLSIGFAAFSSTMTFKSSATVNPSSEGFNVVLSKSNTSATTGTVSPSKTPTTITASSATLTGTTISNISATFTEPGQSVVYNFYVYNAGQYVAYLRNITFQNASGSTKNKVCTAGSGTTDSLVQAACNGINLTVQVGNFASTNKTQTYSGSTDPLNKLSAHPVTVTLDYTGTAVADGDFTVKFGDISLEYSSTY